LHLDSAEAFTRICERLPDPAAKQAVRQAAARLASTAALLPAEHGGEGEKSFVMMDCIAEASFASSGTGSRVSVSRVLRQPTPTKPSSTRLQSPRVRANSGSPVGPRPRVPSAHRASSSAAEVPSKSRLASPLRRPDAPKTVHGPKTVPAPLEPAPEQPPAAATADVVESLTGLTREMRSCGREQYKAACGAVARHAKQVGKTELCRSSSELGQALLDGLKSYFGSHACTVRCWPLIDLLAELCGLSDFVRALPDNVSRSLLRELLKNLYNNRWTEKIDDGKKLLESTNLACVTLLKSMSKPTACSLLLDLGMREAEVVSGTLVGKCLKKMYTRMSSSSETLEKLLNVSFEFALKARGKISLAQPGSSADKDTRLMVGHARELAASVRRQCPELAESWRVAKVGELDEKDVELIEDLLGATESSCLTPAKSRDSSLTGGRQSIASLDECLLEAGPQIAREAPQAPEVAQVALGSQEAQ